MIFEESMKPWERMVGGGGGGLRLEAGFPGPCTAGLREAAHTRVGGRGGQVRTRPPAAAVLAAGIRAVPSRPRGREPLPYSCSPKQNITAFQHPKSSISTPPQTILLIGSSAHGVMRAAEGGPAVRSRSPPARAGGEAGVVVAVEAGAVRQAPGARGPRGGEAPGSAAATAPPAAGALPEQRSSAARLCASSEVLLLFVLLLGLLLLLPLLPQPAPPLPPSPSSPFPRQLSRAPAGGAELPGSLGADCRPRAASAAVTWVPCPRAPGALRGEQHDARGWAPRRSPGEMAGHWAFG